MTNPVAAAKRIVAHLARCVVTDELRADAAVLLEMAQGSQWRPIETAPKDGVEVWVYVSPYYDLPAFQTQHSWHPDAGWCADELRSVTHWKPLPEPPK